MRIILALGALAIISLSGCVEDPYGYGGGYGPGPAYGGGSYGGGNGAPDPSARANYGEEYLSAGFDDVPDGQTLHRDVSGRLWQRLRIDGLTDAPAPTASAAPLPMPHQNDRP